MTAILHHVSIALLFLLSSGFCHAQDATGAQATANGRTTIIAAAATIGGIVLICLAIALWKYSSKRRTATPTSAGTLEVAQAAAPLVPAANASRPRARRPARQASTQTVPEYTKEANEEEMILDKAEITLVEDSSDAFSRRASAHRQSNEGAQPRSSFAASRVTLQDITPAPELRIDRYDTVQSVGGYSVMSSENVHLLPLSGNSSATDLQEVMIDGSPNISPPTSLSGRRASSSSFFASPAYVNRSRSRSVDVFRPMPASVEADDIAEEMAAGRSSLHVPPSTRPVSGLRSIFPKRSSSSQSIQQAPALPPARREALRNRDISAPLAETLVRTSTTYVYPKAGLNPLQAAWLGSRDSINRITTRTSALPPEFGTETEGIAEEAEDAPAPAEAAQSAAGGRLPLRINTVLSQLEEESAQLSSLVSRASLHRASLPPRMVALPPSMPVSPVDGLFSAQSPSSSPRIVRSTSYAPPLSAKVRGPRASMDLSLCHEGNLTRSGSLDVAEVARRRVYSEAPPGSWPLRAISPPRNSVTRPIMQRGISTQSSDSFVSAEDDTPVQMDDSQGLRPRKESQRSIASFATARTRA